MSLVRWQNGTPVVKLPDPLPPAPAVVQAMQAHADRNGRPYVLPNGFEVKPRLKKIRWKREKPKPGWWLRGETSE